MENKPINFLHDNPTNFKGSDPLMVWSGIGEIKGAHRHSDESFVEETDGTIKAGKSSNSDFPGGITIYSENPSTNTLPRIIGKINKYFDTNVRGVGHGFHRLDLLIRVQFLHPPTSAI